MKRIAGKWGQIRDSGMPYTIAFRCSHGNDPSKCLTCATEKISKLKHQRDNWKKTAEEISDRSSQQSGEIEDLKEEIERLKDRIVKC